MKASATWVTNDTIKGDASFSDFAIQWVSTVFTNTAATVQSHDHDDINKNSTMEHRGNCMLSPVGMDV